MSQWDKWVIDATLDPGEGPLCLCPVEGDIDGDYTIVTGYMVLLDENNGRDVVAVVHEDGPDAVIDWYSRNKERVDTFMGREIAA